MLIPASAAHAQALAPASAAAATASAPALVGSAAAVVTPAVAAAPAPAPAPAPVASAPPAPTRPSFVAQETINGADTAWMLTSTALVLMMTLPGIAFFYAGMVRKKSVINTMACVVAIASLVSVLWFAAGYSWAFTPGTPWLGGNMRLWFEGLAYVKDGKVMVSHVAPNVPESVYSM